MTKVASVTKRSRNMSYKSLAKAPILPRSTSDTTSNEFIEDDRPHADIHVTVTSTSDDRQMQLTLSREMCDNICKRSEFLSEVINMAEEDDLVKSGDDNTNISLTETSFWDTITLLLTISSPTFEDEIKNWPWNTERAKLSAKWIVPVLVSHYSAVIDATISQFMKNASHGKNVYNAYIRDPQVPYSQPGSYVDTFYAVKSNADRFEGSITGLGLMNLRSYLQIFRSEQSPPRDKMRFWCCELFDSKNRIIYTYYGIESDSIEHCSGTWTTSSGENVTIEICQEKEPLVPLKDKDIESFCDVVDISLSFICYKNAIFAARKDLFKFLAKHKYLLKSNIVRKHLNDVDIIEMFHLSIED